MDTAQRYRLSLNTSYDDLYFTVSKSGEDGFLASNRPVEIPSTTRHAATTFIITAGMNS